jgi:hypothetical protein
MRYTKGEHLECYKDLDIPSEWENESFDQNNMASFRYKKVVIWIDYPNIKDREDVNKDSQRFTVDVNEEYHTDSFEEVVELVDKYIKHK